MCISDLTVSGTSHLHSGLLLMSVACCQAAILLSIAVLIQINKEINVIREMDFTKGIK